MFICVCLTLRSKIFVYFYLCIWNIFSGDFKAATRYYKKVLEIDQRHSEAMVHAAFAYNQLGNKGRAENLLKQWVVTWTPFAFDQFTKTGVREDHLCEYYFAYNQMDNKDTRESLLKQWVFSLIPFAFDQFTKTGVREDLLCEYYFAYNQMDNKDTRESLLKQWVFSLIPKFIYSQLSNKRAREFFLTYGYIQGRVAQLVTCLATDESLTADPGVASLILARSHTFVEIDYEIISTTILLPSAESFKIVVSYKRKYVHEVLVNCLFKHAQEKVLIGELTVPPWP